MKEKRHDINRRKYQIKTSSQTEIETGWQKQPSQTEIEGQTKIRDIDRKKAQRLNSDRDREKAQRFDSDRDRGAQSRHWSGRKGRLTSEEPKGRQFKTCRGNEMTLVSKGSPRICLTATLINDDSDKDDNDDKRFIAHISQRHPHQR